MTGSGEFHVYKQSRRREYERLKIMDEEEAYVRVLLMLGLVPYARRAGAKDCYVGLKLTGCIPPAFRISATLKPPNVK